MAGQVIRRGDGRWLVRVFLGRDAAGKRLFHNRTIHGRKREAEEYLRERLLERDTGRLTSPSRQTVSELMTEWLATKVDVRERTRADYASLSTRYITPALGNLRIRQISSKQVQEFCNSLTARGLGPRTVKYAYDVLRMAMAHAVRVGHISRNPTDYVKLPLQRRSKATALTGDQISQFIATAEGTRFEVLWLLLVTVGLRPSEALALRWSDFDPSRCEITVRQVLSRGPAGAWRFDDPKTATSSRCIALPTSVKDALLRHRSAQARERIKSPRYAEFDLIFATGDGQPLEYRVVVRRYFKPLLKAAGLPPIRCYDLRHSSATLSMALGIPVKVVSERLGHSTIKQTLETYQHALPHMQVQAAQLTEAFLRAAPNRNRSAS